MLIIGWASLPATVIAVYKFPVWIMVQGNIDESGSFFVSRYFLSSHPFRIIVPVLLQEQLHMASDTTAANSQNSGKRRCVKHKFLSRNSRLRQAQDGICHNRHALTA